MIGEILVKPCFLFVAEDALGLPAAQTMEPIPLSKDTVQQSIEDIAIDVEEQVEEEFNPTQVN